MKCAFSFLTYFASNSNNLISFCRDMRKHLHFSKMSLLGYTYIVPNIIKEFIVNLYFIF